MKVLKPFLVGYFVSFLLLASFCFFLEVISILSDVEETKCCPTMYYQFDPEDAYLSIQNGYLPNVKEIDELEYSRNLSQIQTKKNNIWTDKMFLKLQESVLLQMGITHPIKINSALYLFPCQSYLTGATQVKYHSSDYWLEEKGFRLIDLDLFINIITGTISIDLSDSYPIFLFDRSSNYLDWQHFDYLDVLQSAEDYRGSRERLKKNNNCEIEIKSYDSSNDNWQVVYDGPGENYYIQIEPKTLEVE